MTAKINETYYSGKDYYSDGEIEDELLDLVNENECFEPILANESRWPLLYHLSPVRENILNWFPFRSNSSLLEIGGGCGALTGMLCKKVATVKVVELSKRRATINLARNKSHPNLEIIVGNLNDIKFDQKFDYITLIGVLEYAGAFTDTDSPYQDFLKNIKKLLSKDGKLIIAIENRFGLKYFAGAREDHTGVMFDGITGYKQTSHVRTFGKLELEELLTNSGYSEFRFYYPHPDYKMPMEIYTDEHLPNTNELLSNAPNYDMDRRNLFDEGAAFSGILENKNYPFFSNSFLVECSVK